MARVDVFGESIAALKYAEPSIAFNANEFKDPRNFQRSISPASITYVNTEAAGATYASNVANFYTEIAIRGVADDTNWTANTYKTILSISSGRGLVANMGGPTGLAGTPTTTFEITVDGVLTEVAITATTTGQRGVLGAAADNRVFSTAGIFASGTGSMSAGKDVLGPYASNIYLPGWPGIFSVGVPCLRFKNSLLIRMKTSENNSTTTNRERSAWVQYVSQS